MTHSPACAIPIAQAPDAESYAAAYAGGPRFPRTCNLLGARVDSWDLARPRAALPFARHDLLVAGAVYPKRWNADTHPDRMDVLAETVARLREANRRAPILASLDVSRFPDTPAAMVRDDWWVTDRRANRVRASDEGDFLVNLAHEGLRRFVAEFVERHIASLGLFDGLLVLGTCPRFPIEAAAGQSVHVDVDRDGMPEPWIELNRLWAEAVAELMDEIHTVLPARSLLVGADLDEGLMTTGYGVCLPDSLDSCVRQPTIYRDVLRRYLAWSNPQRARVTLFSTNAGVDPGESPERRPDRLAAALAEARSRVNRMRFGLATALLGDGYYAFNAHASRWGDPFWYDHYEAPLGYPVADAYETGGVWTRPFQGGQVIVNPAARPVRVMLCEPCRVAGEERRETELLIPAQDGAIVVRE